MKLKLFFIVLLINLSSSAFAQYFPSNASVVMLPYQVTAQVYNPYYEPIICSGQVFGQTASVLSLQPFLLNNFYQQEHQELRSWQPMVSIHS